MTKSDIAEEEKKSDSDPATSTSQSSCKELAAQIVQKQQELVIASQRLSSDQKYIRRLHEYNYLKDATF